MFEFCCSDWCQMDHLKLRPPQMNAGCVRCYLKLKVLLRKSKKKICSVSK